jgi:DNA-binding IscR family transcriptional regulator
VLEGPFDIADCADVPNCSQDSDVCALKDIFTRANHALISVFQEVSLAQLAEDQKDRESLQVPMYNI